MFSPDATRSTPEGAGGEQYLSSTDLVWLACLKDILESRRLNAVFQPIVRLDKGDVLGYEGLIRGPSDGPLHSPVNLFKVAGAHNLTLEVESLCCRVILERFAQLGLSGKLFLNVSPMTLEKTHLRPDDILSFLDAIGVAPANIVFELTEQLHSAGDYEALRAIIVRYRSMGFQIAIDDLGEGFSSLRRWSELLPEYIKIDMHFIQGVDTNRVKQQMVRSLNAIAQTAATTIVAEGIETENELRFLIENGIACGQGFYMGHPVAKPAAIVSDELRNFLRRNNAQGRREIKARPVRAEHSVKRLLRSVPVITPDFTNNAVCDIFTAHPELHTLPVVEQGAPLGVITRSALIDRFARPYQRELYGKRPCSLFMDTAPLVADQDTSLQQLSHILVEADRHRLISDFIITDAGRYLGIGTSHDLLRELTDMKLDAARYSNPLTQLPGNVPINQHLDCLLESESSFSACYADLDNFKPFNDVFGYGKGDDIIQMTGGILLACTDADHDFVGHIGGDDFLIVFQSEDWEWRCHEILREFTLAAKDYFGFPNDGEQGYHAQDRSGNKQFYPLPSLSLGVVEVRPGQLESHHQIAAAASRAKTEAKKAVGNSLFVERRKKTPWAPFEPC